jgi:hypothetical protein
MADDNLSSPTRPIDSGHAVQFAWNEVRCTRCALQCPFRTFLPFVESDDLHANLKEAVTYGALGRARYQGLTRSSKLSADGELANQNLWTLGTVHPKADTAIIYLLQDVLNSSLLLVVH